MALGSNAQALAQGALALGPLSSVKGGDAVGIGRQTFIEGTRGVSVGFNSFVRGSASDSVALGADAGATGASSVALGAGSRVDDANSVSIGSGNGRGGPAMRRLTNLSPGVIRPGSVDAINGDQVANLIGQFGAQIGNGSGFDGDGAVNRPVFTVQGGHYETVGSAMTALDTQLSHLNASVASWLSGGQSGQHLPLDLGAHSGQGGGTPPSNPAAPSSAAIGATVLGENAAASASNGTAVGHSAFAQGINDTAIGSEARVEADGSTAVGANVHISSMAAKTVALGEGAQAGAVAATVLGQSATVSAANAVALGQGSVAERASSVSVGKTGAERQLTHLAAGTAATDGVNKAQLDAAFATTATQLKSFADRFEVYQQQVGTQVQQLNRRLDRYGAMSAAMVNMATSASGIHTDNRLGIGVGFQGGERALSLGFQHAWGDRVTVTLGGAVSHDDSSVGVGAGFGW